MIEKISVIAVAVAAILTAINQVSIVITAKQLWRQQQQLQRQLEKLNAGILPKSETPNKILKSQSKYNQTILQDRLGK